MKGALALANCLHAPGRSITASAVTSPKREKKVVIKTTKAKVSLVKAKAKAKVKAAAAVAAATAAVGGSKAYHQRRVSRR